MTAILFENVTKTFSPHGPHTGGLKNLLLNGFRGNRHQAEPVPIITDASFSIPHGQAVAFVGRNGAGKRTLLSLIAGVLRPNKGRVVVDGRLSPLLELGAGFHPDLTGRENIELYGVVLGFGRQEIRQHMDAVIEFSELGEHIDRPVRYYSSGMLARLGFAVVSQLDPEILPIDEVLAVVDYKFGQKCLDVMHGVRKAGKTIVFVSHSMQDVVKLCDRALLIDQHRIVADGPAKDIALLYQPDLVIEPTKEEAQGNI